MPLWGIVTTSPSAASSRSTSRIVGARDAGLPRELALDEVLARLEAALDDRVAQLDENLLANRRGDALDVDRQRR